jgi:CheY-like chemotaxis protein
MAHKLLLADDSITIQKVVELTLSEEDFDVTAVGDGEAALEAAKKLMPDIILADVFMPKMDGYELCGKLRQEPSLKGIPVILLAGTFENFDDALATKVGADDHITKPFESAELIAMVKRLVERRPAPVALEAEPVADALFADEIIEAAPETGADDLWSVVDMASEEQPLSSATEILSEEDLWKRANLQEEEAPLLAEVEEGISWDDLSSEPMAAEAIPADDDFLPEVQIEEEPALEATAILNLDDFGPSTDFDEVEEVEVAEESEPTRIFTIDSLSQAVSREEYMHETASEPVMRPVEEPAALEAAARYAAPATPGMSQDAMREEVARVVRGIIDQKVKEALAGISREMIEQVVWEVVPDLAEEIIEREIQKLKTGIS